MGQLLWNTSEEQLKGLVSSYSCTIIKEYNVEMSAAEHSKCVSIFESDKEEMNEHPLALENGNADKKYLVANVLHTSWIT